jgi:hypothetical protein
MRNEEWGISATYIPHSTFLISHFHLERETGIEPATNSLEGCDSTTELLPLTDSSLAICEMVERVGFEPT